MKSPKELSQEPSLPTQDEARRSNVLLEQMISKFDVFGEVQSDLRDRVGNVEFRLVKLEEKVDGFDAAVRTNGKDINALKEVVHGHTKAIQDNTEAIRSVETNLKNFNQRVDVVETKLAS